MRLRCSRTFWVERQPAAARLVLRIRLLRMRRSLRRVLLSGVSLGALLTFGAPAGAVDFLKKNPLASPSTTANAAAISAAQRAAAAGQGSRDALSRATQAIQAARSGQAAARLLAQQAPSTVPNGLVSGGLMPDPAITVDPTLWQGASLPTETRSNGETLVTIQQTQQKAILNWETFNVGQKTTVEFLQRDANGPHSDWVALNRVNDPAARPSQILGQIKADGGVYLINKNGVIFGGASQVNVHALVASSLDVGSINTTRVQRDQFFLNTGIAATPNGQASFSSSFSTATTTVDGDVVVEKGAQITTTVVDPDAPGFAFLIGANVRNSGTISTPVGQTALIAARQVALTPGVYNDPGANGGEAVSIRGTGFTINAPLNSTVPLTYRAGTGSVVNEGIIETPRGITILNGNTVHLGGVVSADTSITRNSRIFADAVTAVRMSGTVSMQPFRNGETLPLANTSQDAASAQTFVPPSLKVSAYSVSLEPETLISAPGANASFTGYGATTGNFRLSPTVDRNAVPQRVHLKSGAMIDVAGLPGVQLAAAYNIIAVQPRGTEFADFPLQKDGPLFGKTMYVDIRDSGTRSDGTTWVGTPLADLSGFVGLVGQSIDQLLTIGGSVALRTEISRPGLNDVIVESGSTINVRGGYLEYLPGFVRTTVLLGADGHRYAMNKADPNLRYVGVAGEFIVERERAGITETYSGPFASGRSVFQPGYIEGRDSGGISVTTGNPVLNGTLLFGSVAGDRQITAGIAPSVSGSVAPKQRSSRELPSQGYLALSTPSSVVITRGQATTLPDGFDSATPLPPPAAIPETGSPFYQSNSVFQVRLSDEQLSSYGLSGLSITGIDLFLPESSTLALAPGGQFAARTFGAMDIQGQISAPGGRISLKTDPYGLDASRAIYRGTTLLNPDVGQTALASDISIGPTARLSAQGRWVNDFGASLNSMVGPAFIDGGIIDIATNSASVGTADATGSILVRAGSVMDVSSGGYINTRGVQKRGDNGIASGKGGSISLSVYQGPAFVDPDQSGGPPKPSPGWKATVQPLGILRGYGFSTGGTLTIASPNLIQLGGAAPADRTMLNLPSTFLDGGFAQYVFKAVSEGYGTINSAFTLAADETVALLQRNLSSAESYLGAATGADIGRIAPLVVLSEDLRAPVNLTVAADNILLDQGSSILADPGAKITLQSAIGGAASALIKGQIVAHGGELAIQSNYIWFGAQSVVDLSGTFVANSLLGTARGTVQNGTLYAGGKLTLDTFDSGKASGFVVAEAGASLDLSGAKAVLTTSVGGGGGRAGKTVAGGTEYWTDGGTASLNTRSLLWAGTFATEAGDPRGNRATLIAGGSTVVLQNETANAILNVERAVGEMSAAIAPTSAAALASVNAAIAGSSFNGLVIAAADKLTAFDNVYLTGGVGGLSFFSTGLVDSLLPAPIVLNGDVAIALRNRLFLAGSAIQALPSLPGNSTLSAPYILLSSSQLTSSSLPAVGTSAVRIVADTLDIRSAIFSGFARTEFDVRGDIRLMAPPLLRNIADEALNRKPSVFYGGLIVPGDAVFTAQRVYPVSAVDFTIASTSPTGLISFAARPGGVEAPLSAGGSLTVSAWNIFQGGNLFAPAGKIALGTQTVADLSPNDPFAAKPGYFVATDQVTVGAGSVTSVSLAGLTVPYGQTQDNTNWFYNADTSPLATPPVKTVKLLGDTVVVDAQATVDLRGGGDLQALEFVPGRGGSRDALTSGADGKTVYALLPSRPDAIAPYDIDFTFLLGDKQPLAGQQIFLSGGNGIAAGLYTLYPAHYATLPGALRVVEYGSTLTRPGYAGAVLPDGTVVMTGHYAQSTRPDARSAGSHLFALQTEAVWRGYSEFVTSSANSYFTQKAAHDGVRAPLLPNDGGRLAIGALSALDLAAQALSSPGIGGRGGQLDIAGAKLNIIAPGDAALSGYAAIDAAQLSSSGFESILLGGLRTDTASGTLITPTATSLIVDTQGTPLTAPEIILAATGPTKTQSIDVVKDGSPPTVTKIDVTVPDDSAGPSGEIVIRSNSIVEAVGSAGGGQGRSYIIGSAVPQSVKDAAELQQVVAAASQGQGAVVLLSNDPNVSLTQRTIFTGAPATVAVGSTGKATIAFPSNIGFIDIGSNAIVRAAQHQVLGATAGIDAIKIDASAVLGANTVKVAASSIAVGATPAGSSGFALTPGVLEQLSGGQSLSLQTLGGAVTFVGPVDFNPSKTLRNLLIDTAALVGADADVAIHVGDTLTLKNSGAAASFPHTPVFGGTLTLDAGTIALGGGDLAVAGFGAVDWTASEMVIAQAAGTLQIGANATPVDLTVTTPNMRVGAKTSGGGAVSQFSIETLGGVTLQRPAGAPVAPSATDEIGGSLLVTAADIDILGTIQALAGKVELRATTGDVVLGADGLIAAGGHKQSLFDADRYVSGGKVVMTSALGDVRTIAGSVIDLAQPSGGLAGGGSLLVSASQGDADIKGAILATGGPGLGGTFRLDTKGSIELDALAALLSQGGVTGEIDIHTRSGNLLLSPDVQLVARRVGLTADDATAGNGTVTIAGLIDARAFDGALHDGSHQAGGTVELFGHNAVTLAGTGQILASTGHADERGGDVVLGLAAGASGVIDLAPGSLIDVSGGSAGGLVGGTVKLRAPILVGQDEVAVGSIGGDILGARSLAVEAFVTVVAGQRDAAGNVISGGIYGSGQVGIKFGTEILNFDGIIDPAGQYGSDGVKLTSGVNAEHVSLYDTLASEFVQGRTEGLGFYKADPRIKSGLSAALQDVYHFQPGIELVNNDPNVNGGNITVTSNWNLAAGVAYDAAGVPLATGAVFDMASSAVKLNYRYGIEPGALTLRALRDIQLNASISDGFFQFADYTNATYQAAAAAYAGRRLGLNPNSATSYAYNVNSVAVAPVPTAPYNAAANGVSPDGLALAAADLFPHELWVIDNLTGDKRSVGLDSWSLRMVGGADATSAKPTSVISPTVGYGDVVIDKHTSYRPSYPTTLPATAQLHVPTTVRTGTGGIEVAAARDLILADHTAPGVIYTAGRNTALLPDPGYVRSGTTATVTDPLGFFEPRLLAYGPLTRPTGPLTAAAFPEQAGDIEIYAGRDIIGFQNVLLSDVPNPNGFGTENNILYHQLYAPWLLSMTQTTPSRDSQAAGIYGAGIFAPGGVGLGIAQQPAWWIQFGSFDQGVLSAGGNVTVTAGRDMRDFSVSLPSTGRVSGGLSVLDSAGNLNVPVTHVYGSGDLTVNVGRDLYAGAFYVGSGRGEIVVGGSVRKTDWVGLTTTGALTPVGTVLAVDSGQLDLTAAGSIAIEHITNPAQLHNQTPFLPSGPSTVALFMDTYGPDSEVALTSIGGDVMLSASQLNQTLGLFPKINSTAPSNAVQTYPATLEITALSGSITMPQQRVILSESPSGALKLLARDTLDLSGGRTKTPSGNPPPIAAGPSILQTAFNAYRPNSGEDGSASKGELSHLDDPAGDLHNLFYAGGDIIGDGPVSSPRPTKVQAGNDIIDLSLTTQNLRPTDVSSVIAGHDIAYTGLANFGGLRVTGPGFFWVEAGRDLGPFVPAAFNTAAQQVGIASAGNATASPVGNELLLQVIGPQNLQFVNKRNFLLGEEGATISVSFGTAKGADYEAVGARYVDPANQSADVRNYLGELRNFLESIGIASTDANDAWSKFDTELTPLLRNIFLNKVVFSELQATGDATSDDFNQFQRGYTAVETLFPAALGYTANRLGGGVNGAEQPVRTGDLDLLHATIQTQHGGDIMIMGPGGRILVGSVAIESNKKLKLPDLGILTLAGGGIYSMTDWDVLVGQSRIFTMQGGDLLLWTSNGDIDAGRGARTTTSLPPLAIIFNNDNFQTVDLGGLVTGAGIAVLQTSDQADPSNAFLIAPVGKVDAGDAGIRVSGNLSIAAALVVNADNISVAGSASGVPVAPSVNVGALSAASSTAAAAGGGAATDAQSRQTASQNTLPSIITVEVLGFGEPSEEQKRRMAQ